MVSPCLTCLKTSYSIWLGTSKTRLQVEPSRKQETIHWLSVLTSTSSGWLSLRSHLQWRLEWEWTMELRTWLERSTTLSLLIFSAPHTTSLSTKFISQTPKLQSIPSSVTQPTLAWNQLNNGKHLLLVPCTWEEFRVVTTLAGTFGSPMMLSLRYSTWHSPQRQN